MYLHFKLQEGWRGRQSPGISVSVIGKASIFLEILQQSSAYLSLVRTGSLGHPQLSVVEDSKEEECWQRLLSQFSNELWGIVLICYDLEESSCDK